MRKRLCYLTLVIVVIVLGLLSREIPSLFPNWIGDILWGLMVFIIMGLIFKNKSTLNNAFLAAIFSIVIEVAKFYHTPWLDEFRYTMIGGLILGYVFSFYNILCYITGIAIGIAGERLWLNNADKK